MGTGSIQGASAIEEAMFPDAGGAEWLAMVTRLYARDRIIARFEDAFPPDAVTRAQIDAITAFALSDAGDRIFTGEVSATRIMTDPDAADLAIEAVRAEADAGNSARLAILQRLNRATQLVERSVSGALNLRFAFYRGLNDGGAMPTDLPENMMLELVWAQEPELRRTIVERLNAFQMLAYAEVTDAELETYLTLSDSPAGRAVNAAVFGAFDAVSAELSYSLGTAAAIFISGDDT